MTNEKMISKLFIKLLPIQIFLVIIGGINSVIDSTFASNLIGPDAMAVTGLFYPGVTLVNAINNLLFTGAELLCGRYLGKKMAERTKSIFTIDMISISIIAGIIIIISELIPNQISFFLGARGELIGQLSSYIRGYVIGLLPFCIGTQLTAFLQLEQKEKYSYASIGVMMASNCFFNWLFISKLGLSFFGLGLSTSISNFLFFLIQALYYFTGKASTGFSIKSIKMEDLPLILKNGIPGSITQVCILIRGLILNYLIQHFVGTDGLSALASVMSFGNLYWSASAGVSSAVMLLASIYVGEENIDSIVILMKTFLKKGVLLVTCASAVYMALSVPATNLYFHDPQSAVYQMTLMGFILFPLSCPFTVFFTGCSNYIHCLNNHEHFVRFASIFDGLIGVGGLSLILIPLLGMPGTWISQIGGGFLLAIILIVFAIRQRGYFPKTFIDWLCIPEGFGVGEEDRLNIAINNYEDAVNISEKVYDFCIQKDGNKKRAMHSALCIEELAINIVKHGFEEKKKHYIDLSVSYVKGEQVICFKDDCRTFNPKEASDLFEPEDITHNIGLRIVSKISKSMTYQNTLGLNIITIII